MAARDGSGGPGPTGDLVALICEDEADDVRAAHALLDAGADPNGYVAARDTTPLHEAVAWNRLRIAQALLERGGRVDLTLPRAPHAPPSALSLLRAGPFRPAIWRAALSLGLMNLLGPRFPEGLDLGDRTLEEECCSNPMARLLVRHGADPMRLDAEYRPAATGADLIAPREVTPDLFKRQATPRPGTANPEPCDDAFLIERLQQRRLETVHDPSSRRSGRLCSDLSANARRGSSAAATGAVPGHRLTRPTIRLARGRGRPPEI